MHGHGCHNQELGHHCWDNEEGYPGGRWMPRGMGFGVRRGEFRYLVLMALKEKPMHGYALIQEIGETYQRPISAGLVYPTLQELEDMGCVISENKDGKKTYSITNDGKKVLDENNETIERLNAGKEYAGKVGRFGFMKNLREMQAMVMLNSQDVDEEKMERIQGILIDAKKKMAAVVFE